MSISPSEEQFETIRNKANRKRLDLMLTRVRKSTFPKLLEASLDRDNITRNS
jgi:hypothetical protein